MLIMGALSQIFAYVVFISFARSDCLLIEENEPASTLIGILNLECAVLPLGNNVVAIPKKFVAKII